MPTDGTGVWVKRAVDVAGAMAGLGFVLASAAGDRVVYSAGFSRSRVVPTGAVAASGASRS